MSEAGSGNSMTEKTERDDDLSGSSNRIGRQLTEQPKFLISNDRASKIFLDSNGLRPIWCLLLYLSMARILYLLLGILMEYLEPSNLSPLWLDLLGELVLLFAAFVPALILAYTEARSLGDYGLPLRQAFGKLFWIGICWGMAALTILMLALHGAGAFNISRLSLHGVRIVKFGAFWGIFFLVVAFAEEFLLRGYTQFTLSKAVGFWPAALLLSIAFGAIHFLNPGEAWNGIAAAAAIGLFFCLTLYRTGSLWFAVGFHAAWDWGESFVYSVPDSGGLAPGHLLKTSLAGPAWLSGGSVGPEGSILIFIVLVLLWLIFDRVYPNSNIHARPDTTLPVIHAPSG